MNGGVDHLDVAYEALRAWCHERPDHDHPSTIYGVLGAITRLLGTVAQIVDVIADNPSRRLAATTVAAWRQRRRRSVHLQARRSPNSTMRTRQSPAPIR